MGKPDMKLTFTIQHDIFTIYFRSSISDFSLSMSCSQTFWLQNFTSMNLQTKPNSPVHTSYILCIIGIMLLGILTKLFLWNWEWHKPRILKNYNKNFWKSYKVLATNQEDLKFDDNPVTICQGVSLGPFGQRYTDFGHM